MRGRSKSLARAGATAALLAWASVAAAAEPVALSAQQRRAFLVAYAPILLKRADEGDGRIGQDWITNFDFDRDGFEIANNGLNWSSELAAFVREGRHRDWRIAPTLYTFLVEFMDRGSKSLVLLYHVYHAKDAGHTHDWERLEIRIDGVRGDPGSGERVRYAVVTEHHRSRGRRLPHPDLSFQVTGSGTHLLVWQAPQTRSWGPDKGELHFVRDSWQDLERLGSDEPALVDVVGEGPLPFHYVFVPEADAGAVSAWGARALGPCNAAELASGAERDAVAVARVRRITYALQDIADLFATQWEGTSPRRWGEPGVSVLLESPLVDEHGAVQVPAGPQTFLNKAIDPWSGRDDGRGIIGKNTFWGTYLFDRRGWFQSGFLGTAIREGAGRCRASARPACPGEGLWQHDYFAHEGVESRGGQEVGRWLPGDWYREESGGFDGRWAQLFEDDPAQSETDCAPDA